MPILTHKFSSQKRADEFSKKLVRAGFRPWQTRRMKIVNGLKRFYYEVQYKR